MADGILTIWRMVPPAVNYARMDSRTGGSTPAEMVPVWNFAASSTQHMDYYCKLSEDYTGRGVEFELSWSAASATSGEVRWCMAFRRMADDAEDVDTSHDYDAIKQEVTATAPSASGEVSYDSITFDDGAEIDSLAAGEMCIVRMWRDHDHADDDMSGDAELWMWSAKEL